MLTYSMPPPTFWAIIAVQLMWFIVVFVTRSPSRSLRNCLTMGLILGIPYGFVMDLLIGEHNTIFNYFGYEDSWLFLLMNWLLSYGLAIATIFSLGSMGIPRQSPSWTFVVTLLLIALAMELLYQTLAIDGALLRMLFLGAILLILSEVVFAVAGKGGYLSNLLWGKVSFGRFWLLSFLTGLVYEVANLLTPLWNWENSFPSNNANIFLVVCFGYCVLLYPILAMRALVEKAETRWHRPRGR